MTTFTFPFAFYGTATIEGDIADEARLTVAKDLQLGIDETTTDAPITDNGAVLTFHSYEVGGVQAETFAMIAALRKFATHPLPHCETDAEKLVRLEEFMRIVRCDARAILARLDAIAPDAALLQTGEA